MAGDKRSSDFVQAAGAVADRIARNRDIEVAHLSLTVLLTTLNLLEAKGLLTPEDIEGVQFDLVQLAKQITGDGVKELVTAFVEALPSAVPKPAAEH